MFGIPEVRGSFSPFLPITNRARAREEIARLKAAMLQREQVECPVEHHFTPGIYTRVLTIKAGTFLVGEVHRTEHLNIVAKGEITVLTEDGVRHLEAGDVFAAGPGSEKVGYAHQDTIWINVHHNPDEMRDIAELEEFYIQPTEHSVITSEPIKTLQTVGV